MIVLPPKSRVEYAPPRRATGVNRVGGLAPVFPPLDPRMHDYQKEGALWMRPLSNCLLADDMGVGKTVQALFALPKKAHALVVTTGAASISWVNETKLWRPDLRATVGETLRRPLESEVLVLPYSRLPETHEWNVGHALVTVPMGDVDLIFDECQFLMSEGAQRTQKARRLRQQCRSCRGLSATPMEGDPEDLWGVLMSLGLTGIFNGSKPFFVELCEGKPRYTKIKGKTRRIGYEWGEINPEVKQRLTDSGLVLRRLADDVLDELPEKQFIDVFVPTPEDLKPFLKRIKDEWDEIGPDDLPPLPLWSEASTALAKAKTPYAVEFADGHATSEEPLLVFSAHVEPVQAVGKLKGAAIITGEDGGPAGKRRRAQIVKDFQAGKYRILAMTIQTGGAALNLQHAANVLFIDRAYTPSANNQAYARARRQGNKRERVICWNLLTDHPLDRHLTDTNIRKATMISAAIG